MATTTQIWYIDDNRTVVDFSSAVVNGIAQFRILRAVGALTTGSSNTVGDLTLTLWASAGAAVPAARLAQAAAEKSQSALPAPITDPGTGIGSGLTTQQVTDIANTRAAAAVAPLNTQISTAVAAAGSAQTTASQANTTATSANTTASAAQTAAAAAQTGLASKADANTVLSVTVLPSGDTTGITDVAAINAALVTGNVTLRGTYYTLTPIKMPSDRTLTMYNAEVRRINDRNAAGFSTTYTTNSIIVQNLNQDSTGNQNIRIRGIGNASFRLHTNSDTYIRNSDTTYSIYNYFGFFFMNVTGLHVQDVSIGPTRAFTSNIQVCKNVTYRNVRCNQDRLAANQDGLDIGPGCSNVVFDGITGVTSDDGFSIYAQNTSGSLHPYTSTLTATQRNVTDIDVRNVQMDIGINVFRFQAGDGSQLKRVTASNITNTRTAAIGVNADTSAVFQFGSTNYVNNLPATTDMTDLSLTGYKGKSTWLIGADSNFSNVRMSSISLDDAESLIGYRGLTNKGTSTVYTPQCNNITLDGIVLTNTNAAEPTLMRLPVTQAVNNINIRNVTADTIKWLTRNGGTVTNLNLTNIKAYTVTGSVFGSTVGESGTATNVEAALASGATGVYRGSIIRMALRNTPYARATDTIPAPIAGSQLVFAAGLDPTGGSSTAAGLYIADGAVWNRVLSLANDPAASSVSAPNTPTNLALSGTPTATTATFTFDLAAGATSYPYRVRTVGSSTWLDRTVTNATSPFTATGLTAGSNYELQVAAANNNGTSAYTASVTFTTATASNLATSDGFTTTSSSGIPNWPIQGGLTDSGIVDANGAGTNRSTGSAVTLWWKNATQPSTNNQYGEVTIGALGATSKFAPMVSLRATMDGSNLPTQYFARYLDGTGVILFKVVGGGTATTLGTYAVTLASGGKMRVRVTTPVTGTARLEVSTDSGATWPYTIDDTSSPIASGSVWMGIRWTVAADANTRARAFAWGDV